MSRIAVKRCLKCGRNIYGNTPEYECEQCRRERLCPACGGLCGPEGQLVCPVCGGQGVVPVDPMHRATGAL